ncbi:MAG: cyclic nucleotide-binding domain-containing protein [Chthoniobacter sp.]|nr:cyclic nucleotide-binding domain-containing protein [Chthoniobacter sp.]
MNSLEPILKQHPFFAGLAGDDLALITGCAKNVRFNAGDTLAKEGQPADEFFLLREGRVALGIPSPSGGRVNIETLDAGEVVGWSWLFPPYAWQFDITAVTPVRALALDGLCLRRKCDADPRLGYDLMKRFSRVMADRLDATRLQLLDLYKSEHSAFSHAPAQ